VPVVDPLIPPPLPPLPELEVLTPLLLVDPPEPPDPPPPTFELHALARSETPHVKSVIKPKPTCFM